MTKSQDMTTIPLIGNLLLSATNNFTSRYSDLPNGQKQRKKKLLILLPHKLRSHTKYIYIHPSHSYL